MSLQFNNIREYIWQVYDVDLPEEFLVKECPSLTYLKLVRTLTKLRIDPTGETAQKLFAEAVRLEYHPGRDHSIATIRGLFDLADLHEIIEGLIIKSGVADGKTFSNEGWADGINS